MKFNKFKSAYCVSAVALSLGLSIPMVATAQEGDSAEEDARRLGVITVQARKVEESLQEAPISIAAFSAEALETRGIENLEEIARATAGFAYENFNGALGAPTIRAQTQSRLTNPVQNVASFYNGVYLQRGYMIDQSLLNIGQVEILRGPQSAALGRNAFAGAISYATKDPSDELEFGLELGAGQDDYLKYQGEVSGPIIPGILGGIAGYSYSEYDGSWENNHGLANAPGVASPGNLGGFESEAFMVGLLFTPTENFTAKATYLDNEIDQEVGAGYVITNSTFDSAVGMLNCGAAAPFGGQSLYCGELPVEPILAPSTTNGTTRQAGIVQDPRGGQNLPSQIFSLSADYEFNDQWSLSYLYGKTEGQYSGSSANNYDQETGMTSFLTGRNGLDPSGNGEIESDSHEFRINFAPNENITTYFGAFTSETTDRSISGVGASVNATADPTAVLEQPVFPDTATGAEFETEVTSFFGFLEYENGPWSFSVEGRFTEEDFTEVGGDTTDAFIDTVSLEYFTPRITAGYALTDTNRIYASFAQGTKAGGLNAVPSVSFVDASQRSYDEEENTTYEIGSRNELLGGDLILNGTLFYIEGENLQINEAVVLPAGSTSIAPNVIGNLGKSETLGVELEANWLVNDNLNVYGAFGYADAEWADGTIDQRTVNLSICDDVVCAANGDISGNQLPRSPSTTFSTGFLWEAPLTGKFEYFVGADLGYQSKQYGNPSNTYWIADRTIIDASAGLRKDNFELKVTADNLFDEEYVSSAFDIGFGTSPFFGARNFLPFLGERRRVAVTLSYDY